MVQAIIQSALGVIQSNHKAVKDVDRDRKGTEMVCVARLGNALFSWDILITFALGGLVIIWNNFTCDSRYVFLWNHYFGLFLNWEDFKH